MGAAISTNAPCTITFDDFPDELLLEILKKLAAPGYAPRKDYHNLCFVKPFNRVATELLYSDGASWAYEYDLQKLLRTVLSHPELATLIRHLHLATEEMSCQPSVVKLSSEMKHVLSDKIKQLRLGRALEQHWLKALKNVENRVDVMAALLLFHTPNIDSLEIYEGNTWNPCVADNEGSPFDCDHQAYWAFAIPQQGYMISDQPAPTFENLRLLDISQDVIEIPQLLPLFNIPSLQDLSLIGASEGKPRSEWYWDSKGFPYRTANIKKLSLYSGQLHPDVVGFILQACKRLETFSYGLTMWGDYEGPIDLTPIGDALKLFIACLRKIAIWDTGIASSEYPHVPIDTFVGFECLETLRVDTCVLMHQHPMVSCLSTILPTSLKEVRFDTTQSFVHALALSRLIVPLKEASTLPSLRYLGISILEFTLLEQVKRDFKEHIFGSRDTECEFHNDSDDDDGRDW